MRVTRTLAFSVLLGAPTALGASGWLAFGDLRGHLEPCGCDPATDLGGIRRIGAVVERERALTPDLALFGLGNDVPPPGQHLVKVPFLLRADALLMPTATLLNGLELEQIDLVQAFVRKRAKEAKALNLVLSNARAKSAAAAVASPAVDDGRYHVFGYARAADRPAVEALVEPISSEMLAAWGQRLAKVKDRRKVLLFSGSDEELKIIASAKLFDEIVSSNASPMNTEPGVDEKRDEGLLRRSSDPTVYAVPLGGQGILRGGGLLFEEAKPLGAYLAASPQPSPSGAAAPFGQAKLVTWLTKDVGESDAMKSLYTEYDTAVKTAFKDAGAERLKDLATSPFAGAAACTSCHAKAAAVYEKSKHAHAMRTLKDKGKHQDGECVTCHTVGASAKGGFVSLEASPQFANVQCENCHGPRKEHVADPKKSPMERGAAKHACVSCHNRQHSPEFDPAKYWRMIEHE